jgi:hypothetical protein
MSLQYQLVSIECLTEMGWLVSLRTLVPIFSTLSIIAYPELLWFVSSPEASLVSKPL